MQLENTFTVPVDIDTVFDAMNDPEKITPCFPGATLTSADGDDFTGTVKVKLGPISMTYKGKGTFVERDKSARKIVVDAQGRDSRGNGTASAKATLTMSEDGASTKVVVLTELQVTGKPAQFGRGVLSDVGDKILGQFAECLADEFADSSPAPEPAAAAASSNGSAAPSSGDPGAVATDTAPVSQPAAPTPVAAGAGAPEAAPMASTVSEARKDTGAAVPGASPASSAPKPAAAAAAPAQPRPKRQQAEAIDLLDASGDALTKRLVPVAAGVGVLALILLIIRLARR